jgi:hypothetical protein
MDGLFGSPNATGLSRPVGQEPPGSQPTPGAAAPQALVKSVVQLLIVDVAGHPALARLAPPDGQPVDPSERSCAQLGELVGVTFNKGSNRGQFVAEPVVAAASVSTAATGSSSRLGHRRAVARHVMHVDIAVRCSPSWSRLAPSLSPECVEIVGWACPGQRHTR